MKRNWPEAGAANIKNLSEDVYLVAQFVFTHPKLRETAKKIAETLRGAVSRHEDYAQKYQRAIELANELIHDRKVINEIKKRYNLHEATGLVTLALSLSSQVLENLSGKEHDVNLFLHWLHNFYFNTMTVARHRLAERPPSQGEGLKFVKKVDQVKAFISSYYNLVVNQLGQKELGEGEVYNAYTDPRYYYRLVEAVQRVENKYGNFLSFWKNHVLGLTQYATMLQTAVRARFDQAEKSNLLEFFESLVANAAVTAKSDRLDNFSKLNIISNIGKDIEQLGRVADLKEEVLKEYKEAVKELLAQVVGRGGG